MNDVVINKARSIQRCIFRARQEYSAAGDSFETDYTRQDAAMLNVTRACEQAIDLANHLVKSEKLGVPTDSSECFSLLSRRVRMKEKRRIPRLAAAALGTAATADREWSGAGSTP